MTSIIKHMIFSGGGHNIITMFGAISHLKEEKYIDFSKIKSIDGTSAGALLGFICILNPDHDAIMKYLIHRPWENVFDITPEIIFQAFQSKGLFDIKIFEQILDPIIKSCGIERTITFKQLYEKSGIDFNIYVTELNELKMIRLSHDTSPDSNVIDGIYKSCAIPPLFKPVIESQNCYFDGGIFANYPLNSFIERMEAQNQEYDLSEIFGMKLIYEKGNNDAIVEESNVTEYIFSIIKKLMQHLINNNNNISIPNELLIYSKGTSFETLKKTINSSDERNFLLTEGKRYASVYHTYKMKE